MTDFDMLIKTISTPSCADWAMVIITGLYLLATALIFWTNRKATQAAEAQVTEMKVQFEETKRLEVIPYLYASCVETNNAGLYMSFDVTKPLGGSVKTKNIIFLFGNSGKGPATNFTCHLVSDVERKNASLPPMISNTTSTELPVIIAYDTDIWRNQESICFHFELSYNDLLGNKYIQVLNFALFQDQNEKSQIWIRETDSLAPEHIRS